jgi:hypothetical protein
MRNLLIAAVGAVTVSALVACGDALVSPNSSELISAGEGTNSIEYDGQGIDQTDWMLETTRCGEEEGAEVEGPYLRWNLLATGSSANAKLTIGETEYPMELTGGAWRVTTPYYDLAWVIDNARAEWEGGNASGQLTISHGCPGEEENGDIGAWCSPGFWMNAGDGAWEQLVGIDKTSLFAEVVAPTFYAGEFNGNPTLEEVLTYRGRGGANHYGGPAAPYDLNAFNAVGAALTDALDGFAFDPDLMDSDEQVCPLNNAGDWDEDFYAGWD